jgi:choline dehydrogenase
VAYAKKEIIISAGSINSPQLLMLSGIGPRRHLESKGIQVKKNLPVGQNLMDHVVTILGPFMKSPAFDPNRDITAQSVAEYEATGKGVLASISGLSGLGFHKTSKAKWNNILTFQIALNIIDNFDALFSQAFNIKQDMIKEWILDHLKGQDARFVGIMGGKPKSRGELLLNSSNPLDYPILSPKYFSNTEDIRDLIEGMKFVLDLYENTTAFNSTLYPTPIPTCKNPAIIFKSDAYFECLARSLTISLFHYSGTCAMGRPDSPNSVVDSKLRVIGTRGLRVIDASVMPVVTNGNTNAPTIMIGEKGSDLVLQADDKMPAASLLNLKLK